MTDRVVLAIDGGATKTTLRLARGKNILFEQTTTGSNYQAIGKENVTATLIALLSEVVAYTQTIDAACFAIAGIDTEADIHTVQEIIENSLSQCMLHCDKLTIENDVEATLLGLAQGRDATIIIAGTGAIAFSVQNNSITRTGGWGHRAGDEGSGYWIGKEILHAIFRAADGRGKETMLSELVLAQIGIANTEELMNWLYASDYRNAHTASLANVLHVAAEQQDFVALSIAKKAADELALLAITALSENSNVLFLNGGILQHNPIILERVRHAVVSVFPNMTITLCSEKPIDSIMKRAQLL
ncbi:BadF/BadG/BcrA/BcrD ATPase family protein [Solibacillus sp. CAU 1738]|uniref:N-acetylglucosamine kinase n=1 Tax=Solibacillus sp. CAU 1738 TaxID=3140363 RepID=UPI00326048E6